MNREMTSSFTSLDFDMMGKRKITEKEVARLWDSNAALWADHVRKGWDLYREYLNNPSFLKLIGNVKGKKVLDAGCGEGYNTRILARQGAVMTGVDISKRMIAHGRAAEKTEPLGIRYEVASFTNLSLFAGGTFDIAVSFMALMDSPDYKRAVKEIYRVLRPGGDFFFNMTHPCFMTSGFGWIKDEKGNPIKLVLSHYFSKEHYVERWRFSGTENKDKVPPFAIAYFPMTLSECVNHLVGAGFVLKKLKEPRPSAKLCREQPEFKRWRNTGAIFLHFHARKPQRLD
jgi:ubiquinone/menaquinone biosynthesis C-methylase UbiE